MIKNFHLQYTTQNDIVDKLNEVIDVLNNITDPQIKLLWEKTKSGFVCPECKKENKYLTGNEDYFKYCPFCGVRLYKKARIKK